MRGTLGDTEEEQREGYLEEVSPRWHPQGAAGLARAEVGPGEDTGLRSRNRRAFLSKGPKARPVSGARGGGLMAWKTWQGSNITGPRDPWPGAGVHPAGAGEAGSVRAQWGSPSFGTETGLQCGAGGRRHVFTRLLLCGRRCSRHRVTKENETKSLSS